MNLEIGAIIGDYQVVDVLGAGGMGKVFKVRNTISERIEALKILLPDLAGEPDLADRFLREIKVQASLDHPNIAGLRTAFRFENQLLMVMELVEGISLDQRLQHGPLSVDEAVNCIGQVLSALGYAHRNGVIHRDIKPANMMLTPGGVVKLMDFGIAKGAGDRKLTMTGTTMGSLYYMSPEQIRGSQTLDARSDLYSVGVSLYELVTGKHPFDGDSQFAIMSAHLEKECVPPITLNPGLPAALNDLILVSVNREADRRFQTAEAFQNALKSVSAPPQPAAPPIAAKPAPAPVPVRAVAPAPPPKSRRALWAGAGALCMVAALIAVIQLGPWKRASAGAGSLPPGAAVQNPVTTVQPPAQQPAVAAPNPAPVEQPAASAPAPSAGSVAAAQANPRRLPSSAPHAPVSNATPASGAQAASVTQPAPQRPAVSQPAVLQPAAPLNPAAPAPQPDLSAQRAELQKTREGLAMLLARSTSVHSTLDNLRHSQAASGLGLRGDWLQAASLMDSFLQGATNAIAAGDSGSAKDLMEKGERQLEKLEKALNK